MAKLRQVAQLPEEDAATRTLVSLELEEAIQNRSELELKQVSPWDSWMFSWSHCTDYLWDNISCLTPGWACLGLYYLILSDISDILCIYL